MIKTIYHQNCASPEVLSVGLRKCHYLTPSERRSQYLPLIWSGGAKRNKVTFLKVRNVSEKCFPFDPF